MKLSLAVLAVAVVFFGFAVWKRSRQGETSAAPEYPPAWNLPAGFFQDESPEANAFRYTCSQCHDLPSPSLHDRQGWLGVASKMDEQIKERGLSIPQRQIDLAIDYVIQHTRRKPLTTHPAERAATRPAGETAAESADG